jgi:Ser/Thr protein kinase RdoA (MazF antagonist)
VIHGDCHLGNVVVDAAGACRLVVWEFAGRGIAVLDFAGLLSDCIDYPERPGVVDAPGVAAVVAGYGRHRAMPPAEREALPAAIRFGIAYRTAVRCHLARREGWDEGIQRGFRREQARWAASEAVAHQAWQCLPDRR